jgi:hypothetical protein
MERINKHLPVAEDAHSTIELLLKTAFSTRSGNEGYREDNWGTQCVEC